ncbi:MAG: hypothetical protein LBU88_03120 [Treponema sp.]|jgi:hypothetical protein|nr:hypothetical protein [Treponema sp.]
MKKLLVLCLLLYIAGSLSALENLYAGFGAELNANSRKSVAVGGNLSFGMGINELFDAGFKAGYSYGMDTLSTLEFQGLFRYKNLPFNITGLFVQAELGAVIFFYEGDTYPSFLGGLAAGWRIFPGSGNWYIEPQVRAGYPFLWGVGITVGIPIATNKGKGEE